MHHPIPSWRAQGAACAIWLLAATLAGCASWLPDGASQGRATNFQYQIPTQPEVATGRSEKPGWVTQSFAVAAANPLATDAGYQVLKAGGSAVDAAIAVQMVLTLVEPQSSGIGGGAFLLFGNDAVVQAYDGRETAPVAVGEDLFLQPDGGPMSFEQAVVGGRSVGTPGVVRMLELAHREHGQLPWAQLIEPAIALAEQGFAVSPRLHQMLAGETALRQDPEARRYFYDAKGQPWPVGHVLKNPALAEVLRRIAREGAQVMHEGELAEAMVQKVRSHPANPGLLSLADLAGYQPQKREPLCHDHVTAQQIAYVICGFPPPSSGALAIGQILGILQHTPAAGLPLVDGLPSADWLYAYGEAARLAFADRAQYVADPDFVVPPGGSWHSLLDGAYLRQRAGLVGTTSMGSALPGVPPGPAAPQAFAPMAEQPEYGTSHISVVDGQGNAVAMTTTIEAQFGARQMVHGFLLNNELTDFSFAPRDAEGRPVANRVEPGKRPRSSMAPTLVYARNSDGSRGALLASLGSPGGALIIHYTAKTLYGVLDWGLTPQQAIDLPNFGSLNGPTLLEAGMFPAPLVEQLKTRGSEVREVDMTSGLQAITQGVAHGRKLWFGGADPRREGIVMGD
ncbi:gamma-glutamyltransferase family protein [Corticibacter populi]|uniref:Gamma-glutamyltransferase family protein n=1 Tax=Corticibacter populi TaxID=1550736 RepID=A0A3M6QKF4_9BURK|nr:gamma-glutamyltransferase family protein [Corticibacter populi]RMX03584.1 gamma-glutamyltransferase family protein [Corticibacter populi]RZS30039.1 gamma-glutamyltransferase 1 [Corticibacter populi]